MEGATLETRINNFIQMINVQMEYHRKNIEYFENEPLEKTANSRALEALKWVKGCLERALQEDDTIQTGVPELDKLLEKGIPKEKI